jgi:hypothetical protein
VNFYLLTFDVIKHTVDLAKKKMDFVAKYSPQGNKVIIIIPKEQHNSIKQLKNQLHALVLEIIE